MSKFFCFETRENKSLSFEELVRILLEIYFLDLILNAQYRDSKTFKWSIDKINLQQFQDLISRSTVYMTIKHYAVDIDGIFNALDTNHDGFISFEEYMEFIKKYLGGLVEWGPKPDATKPI